MQRSQGTVTALCLKLNRGDIEITKRVFWRRRRKWYVFCIKWKLGKSPSPRLGFKPMTLWDLNPQISSGAPIVSIDAENVSFSSSKDSLGSWMVASLIYLNVTAWWSSARSRPWDKGGCSLQKNFLRPFGPQFGLKIRGRVCPPGPSPESTTVQFRVICACPGLTMWLCDAVLLKEPHFTLARHQVSSGSVVRASD